jgi:Mg-chelatase subunit ChlD
MIPIEETSLIGSNDDYSYPTSWKLGDPIEDIDMMLTFSTSPIFIPGVTTKKWEKNSIFNFGNEKKQLDLLLVIDTSGSMGDVRVSSSNMHQAVLVSYGIINFFESTKSQVALIGFSDKITANIEWTKKYDEVREKLLVSGNGGTSFPINSIQRTLEDSNNEIVTVVVTDGEINNLKQTVDYFKDYLNAGNKLFIFLQNRKVQISSEYEILMNSGAKIIKGLTANEMCNTVLNEINED